MVQLISKTALPLACLSPHSLPHPVLLDSQKGRGASLVVAMSNVDQALSPPRFKGATYKPKNILITGGAGFM